MRAIDVMSAPVYVVAPADNVAYARNLMLKHRVSRLPVMEGDDLRGILTKKDIAYRLRQTEPIWRRRPIDRIPVSILMAPDPITVKPETNIRDIAAIMLDRDISGLPVINDGKMTGIVTKLDVMRSTRVRGLSARVGDIMEDAATVNRYHSLDHVIDTIKGKNDKLIVVNDNGSLAGIITESNLAFYEYQDERMNLPRKDVTHLRKEEPAGQKRFRYVVEVSAVAEDIMSRPVITVTPDASLQDAVGLMLEHQINSLVVVEDGDIRGMLKRDDIIKEVAK
ncbi:CBS domain-containing protein [Methanoculleus sp. YWC-01]|jgi:CBS domain-containing protein|uniref:CBS domain-containing protein n=1 Tax=Methanoculleus nereidis TaxID=2735141 RepID=A0ABU3Z0T7_9EURY|nr:CBS domain-containing protein [Methanoculleus sp. YWC-01]MDV4342435.1 CBS domain-containing protein [Methanoculleus sp. YWC-01]PKL56474.1 MAG: CBS domain-containing protein [Methanomicrobiales archaeon HGW-Methanomicrobiales-6]